jgi:hypothetical protein
MNFISLSLSHTHIHTWPAGSGKTVCGEAAVYAGLALGKRVLYTTPLKALSNQKFYDFKKQFGAGKRGQISPYVRMYVYMYVCMYVWFCKPTM